VSYRPGCRRKKGDGGDIVNEEIDMPEAPFAVLYAMRGAADAAVERYWELILRSWGAGLAMALAVSAFAEPAYAQPSFKTVRDMARECITDDLYLTGSCSGYILGSIDTLESARRARGENPCIVGRMSKDDVAKAFKRAMLDNYAEKGDLPAAVLIEDVYRQKCGSRD
jgi:hypothetical protein